MNVLVLAPHPDDEVLGCGGTVGRHVAAGDRVDVLVATRGAPELYPDEAVALVRDEARQAHRLLGIDQTTFFDFPAPALDTIPRYQIASAIAAVLRERAIHTLYIPHHGDIHSDHFHLYHAALVAARPLPDCPVRRILVYETISETEWAPPLPESGFHPTVFIDISEHLAAKMSAMECYQTQIKPPPSARSLRTIEALARFRGATISRDAAEAFMLVREIDCRVTG